MQASSKGRMSIGKNCNSDQSEATAGQHRQAQKNAKCILQHGLTNARQDAYVMQSLQVLHPVCCPVPAILAHTHGLIAVGSNEPPSEQYTMAVVPLLSGFGPPSLPLLLLLLLVLLCSSRTVETSSTKSGLGSVPLSTPNAK